MHRDFSAIAESQKVETRQVKDTLPAPDLTNTYFFDHALDHLPGTYLVSKTIDTAIRHSGLSIANFSGCRFDWHEFAELDQDIVCQAQASASQFEGHLSQKRELATFEIHWKTNHPEPLKGGEYPDQTCKPDPVFAHKNLAGNVLVSDCQRSSDDKLQCYAYAPEEGHMLQCKSDYVQPLFLLESCKQFLTVAGQTMFAGFSNQCPNSKFQLIMKNFALELARPIASSAVLHLKLDDFHLTKWRRNVPKAAEFTVSLHVGDETAGKLSLKSLIVDPDFFRFLRSQSK